MKNCHNGLSSSSTMAHAAEPCASDNSTDERYMSQL